MLRTGNGITHLGEVDPQNRSVSFCGLQSTVVKWKMKRESEREGESEREAFFLPKS